MSEIPENLSYTKDHEWASLQDDGKVKVGITDHAQDALSDVVFVELPDVGSEFVKGDAMAVAESVKAASDIYAPVSGKIISIPISPLMLCSAPEYNLSLNLLLPLPT